ncbi:hypothetical protein EXIGLDRAFT_736404 [Exidia glandulosa HHB12029]|uniref:Uncharacterized protein n=1 Tax=Exidia glandulosa HHB12029 TaxID=1314781 RepID=A0A165JGK3_EXIGL|nr:hypothetical protein EXIGLDRAFT_736404 [Exidia glandulosa HHB12029]
MARIEEIDSSDAGASPAPHGFRAHGPDRGESGNPIPQTIPTHPRYTDSPMSLDAHGDASYAELYPPTPSDGSTYRPITVTTLSYTAHGVHTIDPRGLVNISRGHSPPYMHMRAHAHAFAHARNARRRQAMRTDEGGAGQDSPLDEKLQKRRRSHAWPPPRPSFKAHRPGPNRDEDMPMSTTSEELSGVASAPAFDSPLRGAISPESHSAPVSEKSRGWVMNDREMDAVSAALARFSC